jgi:hypothetical protein
MDKCGVCDLNLIISCKIGDFATAKSLFEKLELNPNAKDNLAIVYAVETGMLRLIELFIRDDRIPNITKYNAIDYYACLFGRHYTTNIDVEYLISILDNSFNAWVYNI